MKTNFNLFPEIIENVIPFTLEIKSRVSRLPFRFQCREFRLAHNHKVSRMPEIHFPGNRSNSRRGVSAWQKRSRFFSWRRLVRGMDGKAAGRAEQLAFYLAHKPLNLSIDRYRRDSVSAHMFMRPNKASRVISVQTPPAPLRHLTIHDSLRETPPSCSRR